MADERTADPLPPLARFELTFSPAHDAYGRPFNRRASRQELQFRLHHVEEALTSQAAVDAFERREDRMVTGCTRLQEDVQP